MAATDVFRGRCAIVTGAAGGIGLEFCRSLAAAGCNVIAADVDSGRLAAAATSLGREFPEISFHQLTVDLTRADAVETVEAFCRSEALDPEILINNAGIFTFKPLVDIPDGKTDCFIALHVGAVTRLSQWMARRCAAKRKGWILNMSSMSCWMPVPGLSLYAATKAYIRVFTRSLAYEMRDCGVSVMAACPGGIATDLFGLPDNLKRLAVSIGALDTPSRFASKALKHLAKGKSQYINGPLNRLSILAVGATPGRVRMLVKHRLLDKGITR